MEFLRRIHGVTVREKERSCEILKPRTSTHFSFESRDPSYRSLTMCPECRVDKNRDFLKIKNIGFFYLNVIFLFSQCF